MMDITAAFNDDAFKAYILEHFCEGRERIEQADVAHISELDVSRQGLVSLGGIEHFGRLEVLDCSYNKLTTLELDSLRELQSLTCGGNRLTNLNTSELPLLQELNVNQNELLALNLTANPELEVLDCGFNRLRQLDVSGNPALTTLTCYWNLLSELELGQNTLLQTLECGYNALFELSLVHNKSLVRLDCGHNYLSRLNLTACAQLEELRCNHNHLTELDLSGNPTLKSLRCFNTHISELELSHIGELAELFCSDTKIAALALEQLPKLKQLDIANTLIAYPDYPVDDVGTFVYDPAVTCYSANLDTSGQQYAITTEASDPAAMERLAPYIQHAWQRREALQADGLAHIAELHPDENVSELVMSEWMVSTEESIRIGFEAGETPSGHLVIYVVFDAQLERDDELVYEIY